MLFLEKRAQRYKLFFTYSSLYKFYLHKKKKLYIFTTLKK